MSYVLYSIIVPCYKSGEWLEELVQRTEKAMKPYQPYEILLINDKSPDQITWTEIKRLVNKYSFIRGIDLLYNVGQFKAVMCGFEYALGEFVITMDDDLQHPPEEIPKLIKAVEQHPTMDCIMGKYLEKKHNIIRNTGTLFMQSLLNRLYNKPSGVVTTSFRIMPASFAKSLLLYKIAHPHLGPLIVSLTNNVINIPVEHEYRKHGSSGYSFFRSVKEVLRSIINASVVPLRLFSFFGFFTAFLAFTITLVYFVRWLFGGIGVAGFTTMVLSISFFSGMMLAGIGILGEYIGRIIQELTGMPRYHVKKIIGTESTEQ